MLKQLPYGLRKNILVSIEEVESGLKCECLCPACGDKLVAKKGKEKAHHFAHYNSDCKWALETALHLAGKEILERKKTIKIPSLEYFDNQYDFKLVNLTKPAVIHLDSVRLEVSVGNYKPDIIAKVGDVELQIEIAVTHFVDSEKKIKVRERGVSMLEIDLNDLQDGYNQSELENLILHSVEDKYWIFNVKEEKLIKRYNNEKASIQRTRLVQIEKGKVEYERMQEKKLVLEKEAKDKGYEILQCEGFEGITCSKLIYEKGAKLKDSQFSIPIKDGAYWNGKIYKENSTTEFVYLDNEKTYLSYYENAFNSLAYRQAKHLLKESNIFPDDKCIHCKFLHANLDDSFFKISCKFRKERLLD